MDLSIEHVEMLLNRLILDGVIERIPAFGAAFWNPSIAEDEDDETNNAYQAGEAGGHRRSKRKCENNEDDCSAAGGSSSLNAKTLRKRRRSKATICSGSSYLGSDIQDAGTSDATTWPCAVDSELDQQADKTTSQDINASMSLSDDDDELSSCIWEIECMQSPKRHRAQSEHFLHGTALGDVGTYVYRAIREERFTFSFSYAPCVH
ncbi:hypothetical protein AcW1_010166 [Taiwanofungus camphoratus]|nr:hypothetical protein AcW1_010166 [Antrodia cinnamomea]